MYIMTFFLNKHLLQVIMEWKARLKTIFDENPLEYFKLDDFEANGVGPLKEEAVQRWKNKEDFPVGQKL